MELLRFNIHRLPENIEGPNTTPYSCSLEVDGTIEEILAVQEYILSDRGTKRSQVVINNVVIHPGPDKVVEAFTKALEKAETKHKKEQPAEVSKTTVVALHTEEPSKGEVTETTYAKYEPTKLEVAKPVVAEEPQPAWALDAYEAMTLAEVVTQALKGSKNDKEKAISWCLDNADRIPILGVIAQDKRRTRLTRAAEVVL